VGPNPNPRFMQQKKDRRTSEGSARAFKELPMKGPKRIVQGQEKAWEVTVENVYPGWTDHRAWGKKRSAREGGYGEWGWGTFILLGFRRKAKERGKSVQKRVTVSLSLIRSRYVGKKEKKSRVVELAFCLSCANRSPKTCRKKARGLKFDHLDTGK